MPDPKPLLVCLATLATLSVGAAAPLDAPDESDFQRGLAVARELVAIRRWSGAARQLDQLLAEHERAPYALPYVAEIVDLYERSAYFEAHPEPAPASLVAGDLRVWDPATGRLTVRYEELPGDLEERHGVWVHPVELTGPYTVVLRGRLPDVVESEDAAKALQVLVGVEGEHSWQVVFGFPSFTVGDRTRWIPARLVRNGPDGSRVVAVLDTTPLALGRAFELEVELGRESIVARADGRSILSAAAPEARFGRVALPDLAGIDELTLSGTANPAWLRGRADRALVRELETFRRTWDRAARIPAWVLEALPRAPAEPRATKLSFPLRVPEHQLPRLTRLSDLYAAGEVATGLAELDALGDRDLEPALRELLRALFLLDAGSLHEALAAAAAATAADAELVEARVIRGRVLGRLGRVDEALELLRGIVADEPPTPLAWSECARWCLLAGRPAEAKTVVDRALVLGVDAAALEEVRSILQRALGGPVWNRVHEYASAHFVVRSDLSRQACFDAAQVLEESRRLYERRLGRLSRRARGTAERAPVYVFAGRAGYDAYGRDVFGLAPDTTVGAFSPELKQLLVWSSPDRAGLVATLRHEGLHQYLDRGVGQAPVWLNEGLAEYFESAKLVRGTLVDGVPQERHVEKLLDPQTTWVPFEELLAMGPAEFYGASALHYAQSWALVHWLQESGLAAGRVFQGLVDDLAAGKPADALGARVLGVDGLLRKVREHVKSLDAASGG